VAFERIRIAAMRLELGTFPVEEVLFGSTNQWQDGRLVVNRGELVELIRSDSRITGAKIELASPGESTRITHVRDVVEPRIKVRGPGAVYPGVCGRPVTVVGDGQTHRLAGVSVVEVSEVPNWRGAYGNDTVIDMSGPAAEIVPYGSLFNLCVVLEVDPSIDIESQNDALHRATLAVSDRLAATIVDLDPPALQTFELIGTDLALPKVVYITCHNSPEHYAQSLTAFGTAIYGFTRQTPPWVLHPNELLDGAISCSESWAMVNNPVVLELYSRHGRDLDFAGCIAIRTRWSSQDEKDVTATQCAKLAMLLGAEGAVVTWDAGGNDFMEVIRTVQACESAGVQTVFMTSEEPAHTGGPPLLEPLPEARAIVSAGVGRRLPTDGIDLPPVDRVIGPVEIVSDTNTRSAGSISAHDAVKGPRWADHYGFSRMSAFEF
jgi:sarcosine reductase